MHVAKFALNYPDMELYFEGNRILFLNKGELHGHPMWDEYVFPNSNLIYLWVLEQLFDYWEFEGMKEPDYSYPAFNPEKLKKCKISFERSDLQCLGAYQGVIMHYESKKGVEHKQFIETMRMRNISDYFRRCVALHDYV